MISLTYRNILVGMYDAKIAIWGVSSGSNYYFL